MSSDKNKLLGKKREVRSDDEEKEEEVPNKRMKADQEQEPGSESGSESEDAPVKSLFGSTNEKGFQGGLFGDLTNPSSQPKSLFGGIFGSQNQPSIFGNSQNNPQGASTLFGGTTQPGIFSQGSTLFNFSESNLKKETNGEGSDEEGDDNIGKCDSPNHYNPTEETAASNSSFKKIYVKLIEGFYQFNKETKAYASKGTGFLSIETSTEDGKRYALLMFRNSIGNALCEGILNEKFNKCTSYVKKFKHVAVCYFIVKSKDNKPEGNNAKIPFLNDDDLKEFEKKYKEAIDFLSEASQTTDKPSNTAAEKPEEEKD